MRSIHLFVPAPEQSLERLPLLPPAGLTPHAPAQRCTVRLVGEAAIQQEILMTGSTDAAQTCMLRQLLCAHPTCRLGVRLDTTLLPSTLLASKAGTILLSESDFTSKGDGANRCSCRKQLA